jgi:hypothetical protein
MGMVIRRRSILKLTGAAGAALSLEAARGNHAAPANAPSPRRLVLIYTPWGTLPEAFWPRAAGDLTASPILGPLRPHRAALTLVEGFAPPAGRFGSPWLNAMTTFTGRDPFETARRAVAPGQIDGPSLDEMVAAASADGRPVLRLATGRPTANPLHDVSFGAGGRAFGLDPVRVTPAGELCEPDTREAARRITRAFAADQARIAVWRMATPADGRLAGLDVAAALAAPHRPAAERSMIAAQRFFATQVAGLVAGLTAAHDGERSLFDGTVVLWASGASALASGASVPVAVLGNERAAGLAPGHVRVPAGVRDRYADLLSSIGRAVCPELPAVGDPRRARGPVLDELTT